MTEDLVGRLLQQGAHTLAQVDVQDVDRVQLLEHRLVELALVMSALVPPLHHLALQHPLEIADHSPFLLFHLVAPARHVHTHLVHVLVHLRVVAYLLEQAVGMRSARHYGLVDRVPGEHVVQEEMGAAVEEGGVQRTARGYLFPLLFRHQHVAGDAFLQFLPFLNRIHRDPQHSHQLLVFAL